MTVEVTASERMVDAIGKDGVHTVEVSPPPYDLGDEIKVWDTAERPQKFGARLRTVIEMTAKIRGKRTDEDPQRFVTQYFSLEGALLAEKDAWAEPVIEALEKKVEANEARVQATERKLQETVAELDATRKQRDELTHALRVAMVKLEARPSARRRR
jgi:hypothetical protein